MLRDLAGDGVKEARFEFHPGGSLATTYRTQGSDIGLAAGLIGMDILDPRMPDALEIAREAGLLIDFRITDYPASHPNTYRCQLLTKGNREINATALSTGGGMIRFTEIDRFKVDLRGDFTILYLPVNQLISSDYRAFQEYLAELDTLIQCNLTEREGQQAIILSFKNGSQTDRVQAFLNERGSWYRLLRPVMPVAGYAGDPLPFRHLQDLYTQSAYQVQPASEFAVSYESARSGQSRDTLDRYMACLVQSWRSSIAAGLAGTSYPDRIAGSQSPQLWQRQLEGRLIPSGPLNRMIAYSTALMEVKSSMGVIIAAPTAGSCGGLPGCLIGLADEQGLDDEVLIRGFWAAGLAGLFIARDGTFAAEVAGCQAETGAGAAMAAAGLVEMFGGTAQQAMGAASMALQNIIGLVCDPVANRVEIPCLGRNAAAVANALASANLILGGVDPVIPFDETITTMMQVGTTMPHTLRCTALGGLSVTPTA
ncbi:MAG: L-serine ammonia-lyase, iron-sulfur-dependent, subunit alpha, partial [Bacteroidales bacterium]